MRNPVEILESKKFQASTEMLARIIEGDCRKFLESTKEDVQVQTMLMEIALANVLANAMLFRIIHGMPGEMRVEDLRNLVLNNVNAFSATIFPDVVLHHLENQMQKAHAAQMAGKKPPDGPSAS